LTSPFAPFITEELYQNLNNATGKENYKSVHLVDLPIPSYIDKELEEKMDIAQRVVYLTRSIRAKANLKVRQPLKKIMVAVDQSRSEAVNKMKDVILEEVNIKELEVLKDSSGIVSKSAKANFKNLGPKYGKLMKKLASIIMDFRSDEIEKLENQGKIEINVDGNNIILEKDDVLISTSEITGWAVKSEDGVTVAVDKELDEDLIAEGFAREFINRVQNMRKDYGLDVIDRIQIYFSTDEKIAAYIYKYTDYIKNETLAENIDSKNFNRAYEQKWEIGQYQFIIAIQKAG
jgi:isoleucyl-tRNA synthetase